MNSPERSIEQAFRDASDKDADKGVDKNVSKNVWLEASKIEAAKVEAVKVEAVRLESNKTENARLESIKTDARIEAGKADMLKSDASRADFIKAESARFLVNRVENAADPARRAEMARAEAQARAEANRNEAVRRSEAMRTETMRTEAVRTDAMRAEAQRRAEANRAEALRADAQRREAQRIEAQRRVEEERLEAARRQEIKIAQEAKAAKEAKVAKEAKEAKAEKDPKNAAIGALAFLSVAGANRELQALKNSDPKKYGKMTLEQVRQHKLSEEVGSRDKMSFMGLAMCNPFFLMALGATFAVMDDIKGSREAKLQKALKNGVNPGDTTNGVAGGLRRPIKGETVEETNKKQADLRPKSLTPEAMKMLGLDKVKRQADAASGNGDGYLKYGLKKPNDAKKTGDATKEVSRGGERGDAADKAKQQIFASTEATWQEKAAARSLKNWIKTDQLVKKKQALSDQMERSNGREQFSVIAGLAAKIQLVDKALKQQGQ